MSSLATMSPVSSEEKASPQVTPEPTGCYSDHMRQGVKDPLPNDVLCGRGGSINSHPGNERFRQLVDKRKRVYLTARFKREKRLIASSIVSEIRALEPPGRFLQQDKESGLWKDIGDEKARDKTSQALRENAPKIRADIETEISVQRAEMQKEEDLKAAAAQGPSPAAVGHAPPPPGYYPPPPPHAGWGSYPPPPPPHYYGYGGPPPPHPGTHPPHSYYPPPPPHHPHAPPPSAAGGHWGYYPPPPPPPPPQQQHTSHPRQHSPQADKQPSSQSTVDYIASSAESVRKWAETSFSFGGGDSSASRTERNTMADHQSVGSKPLSYVHEDSSKKRRMVKFSKDTRHTNRRSLYRAHSSNNSVSNSILSGSSQDATDFEPHAMDEDVENRSLMSSVANHILGSIGSWDAASIMCGVDSTDREAVPFPGSRSGPQPAAHQYQEGDAMEEEMNGDWEGQEVQLMEKNDQDSVTSEDRMPPPPRQVQPPYHENHSIGFSSLGSCYSLMPEQFNDAASSFFGSIRGGSSQAPSYTPSNQDVQMEQQMDYSVENYSLGGSIGGNSLTRVFEHDVLPDGTSSAMGGTTPSQRSVSSWERSYRSRSPPVSVASDDADDLSLISKESSKVSMSGSRDGGIAVSPVNTPRDGSSSVWGTSRE